ncbi:hypothetical protein [Zavarzinella formosa]|nr:hypothetical protein [Zavarzinella formosa]
MQTYTLVHVTVLATATVEWWVEGMRVAAVGGVLLLLIWTPSLGRIFEWW